MPDISMPENIIAVSSRARCLLDESQVENGLDRMAVKISESLSELNPILMCIMNGGLIVSGKLATRLNFPLEIDYLHATRYRDKTTGADLEWKSYPNLDLTNRVVLLVDDILDEGATLEKIINYCNSQGASSVYSAVLLDKKHTRKVPGLLADFVGFEIDDFYLYGYGMDYKGHLRNANGVFAIDESDR
ncbi:MAG: hypoxanthine-guanine phosphoribosyltransferase [Gammaproteobacteria bacterium]|jgi:hypoxanthine phosphoribosyltransferase|nr:hypoxanthine-guanine phosphoribosyltransferase [Gammaproteobacteria bacterium]MBT3858765.1 hypoxanthine-guanine phosphoribosyltransferase [Gammaproteobacteria bacterium]MBT3986117.1 hypoxanthine-guanine phosphoribosyltransferase [Gammaproteobacteria bacterium]MBT4256348.1 hypoxanthine-guanine phosphoribosyltransferase [Gammaproteobacteria bacterium]MBT4581022.1 hypoxanthine-guanine phosphoribosyltransferase [Gammaproteobacteria bacterium]